MLLNEKERQAGRRIKQIEIARELEISPRTVASWLQNDVTKFEAHIVERFCNYFDCDVSDLLYLEPVNDES